HLPRVNEAVPIPKIVGIDAVDVETTVAAPLQDGHAVDVPFEQQVDGMASQLDAVEAIEMDGPPAALSVADLTGENRGPRGFVATLAGEITVSQSLDQQVPERVGGPREDLVSGRVERCGLGAQLASVLVDDALAADDHRVL